MKYVKYEIWIWILNMKYEICQNVASEMKFGRNIVLANGPDGSVSGKVPITWQTTKYSLFYSLL